jgi:conjugative element/phage-associated large polyvalent protein
MAENKEDHSQEATSSKRPRGAVNTAVEDPTPNSIQWVSTDAQSSSGKPRRDRKGGAAARKSAEGTPQEKARESHSSRVPDSVHERFIQIGDNFYFPDGTEAFRREQNRLTTRSENAIVIQSMVAVAREESVKGVVEVGGTDFFKKEAWFAASLAGLRVEGYQPTEFERERLVRALASRRGVQPRDREQEVPGEPKSAAPTSDRPERSALNTNELITGKLVDHGPAPYKHNSKEAMSYFVRIETERGDRDLWGVDLERAFRHSLSNPGIGDEIGIRAIGKEAVTVQAAKRDASGREIGREEFDTHRNQWSVERKEFLDQRRDMAAVFRDPSISAPDGIKRHAGLEGSYRKLEMGQVHAEEQYNSNLHRTQFVDHLREYLAKSIEYGQPLEPARPSAREEQTVEPREPDRDYHPTR